MNHIVPNLTLPFFKLRLKTNPSGELIGLDVKRRTHQVYYHRTSRGLNDYFNQKSPDLIPFFQNPLGLTRYLKNKVVLDIGCGDGTLVHELRKQSVSILGLDLYLKPEQEKYPYFFQADAFQLALPEQQVDFIFSAWSVFSYEPASQISKLIQIAHRILKPNGELFLVGVERPEIIQQIQFSCKQLEMSVYLYSGSSVIRCVRNLSHYD